MFPALAADAPARNGRWHVGPPVWRFPEALQ